MKSFKLFLILLIGVLTMSYVSAQITPVKTIPLNTNPRIITSTTPPDLMVKDMMITFDKLTIKVLVENVGEGASSSGSLILKQDHSAAITKTLPGIAAHQNKWINIPVPAMQNNFPEQYKAEVTAGATTKETNLSNNLLYFTAPKFDPVTLAAAGTQPDITIVEIMPPKVMDGKHLLRVRLVNRGGSNAGGFYVHFYYMIPKGGKEGGSSFVKSLKAGEETLVVFQIPMPSEFKYKYQGKPDPNSDLPPATLVIGGLEIGTVICQEVWHNTVCDHWSYKVISDSQNTVQESDETNNELWWADGTGNFKKK